MEEQMMPDLDEDLWIDDWNDPVVVAASLSFAGGIDPEVFDLSPAA